MSKLTYILYPIGLIGAIIALYAGLSGKDIWFIDSPRMAVITLAAAGMVMCTPGVIHFISDGPAHPLTLLGYLLGALALLILLTHIFGWNISVLSVPVPALWILAGIIVAKSVIGLFHSVLVK